MPLPQTLNDLITAARTMIGQANLIDASIKARNAKAMLSTARSYIVEDSDIAAVFAEVAGTIAAVPNGHDLDDWRASSLGALDRLEQSLTGVRSNDYADALGVGWF